MALNKTEVVILSKKRMPTILPVQVRNVIVETKPVAKYLRVLINMKIVFHQICHMVDKDAKAVTILSLSLIHI